MQKKHIISTALVVASFAGISFAGTRAVVVAPEAPITAPSACAFSGSALVGYSSNYDFRGLVPQGSNGGNMTPIRVDTRYALNDKTDLTMGVGYKAIWDKDSDYNNYGGEEGRFQNEFNYNLGLQHKTAPGLTTSLNYNLFHGGLPGFVARADEGAAHSVTQEFGVGALYDFSEVGAKGLFAAANANYSFQGVTGWWYSATLGYKMQVCEKVAAVLSGTWNATSSYFNNRSREIYGGGANGSQGFNVRLDVPVTLCEHTSLVPFIGAYWSGCGALKNNRGWDKADKAFRNFTVMAGANLIYNF